jgi:hypothetical protein
MTNSGNPFLLFKERSINELFSVSFQYLKNYKKSFFVPLLLIGAPLQISIFYLYIDYYGGIYNSNPWLTGANNAIFSSLFSKSLIMFLLVLISQSFSMSLIFNHLKIFTGNNFLQTDKAPQEMISLSFKLLPKSILILIISFFMILIFSIPLMIIFFGYIYLLSFSGTLSAGILFLYLVIITPFSLLNKNPDEGYFNTFRKNFKNIFSNFWKTWLFSLLLIILFYLSEMLVMMPILIVLISGLFIKTSADSMNILTKIILSSIASFIQILFMNILIVLYLFLYGNNEEKISKRSLKQEIENL